jgi:N-methylhydantoinase A
MQRVLVPELASVLSAFGAATSDVRRERSQSAGRMIPADPAALQPIADNLTEAVRGDLAADGVPPELISVGLGELRFHWQKFELSMHWPGGLDKEGQLDQKRRFIEEYASRYGQGALVAGAPVEIVSLRVTGIGRTVRAQLCQQPADASGSPVSAGTRRIYQGLHNAPIDATVVRGAAILPGQVLTGPAVVDAAATTIWIPRGTTARMDGVRHSGSGDQMTAKSATSLNAVALEVLRSRLQATA